MFMQFPNYFTYKAKRKDYKEANTNKLDELGM